MKIINSRTGEPEKFDFDQITGGIRRVLQQKKELTGYATTSDVKKVDEILVNNIALDITTKIIPSKTTTNQISEWIIAMLNKP